jgi:RHS repeat-associated protein
VTSYQYDELNQLVRVDLPTSSGYPAAHYQHRAYDALGRLSWLSLPTAVAAAGSVPGSAKTTLEHLDSGGISVLDDPANPAVHYDYTARGELAERVPETASGELDVAQTMLYDYYLDGLLREQRDLAGQGVSYSYDADGNALAVTDAEGLTDPAEARREISAVYDGFGRLAEVRERRLGETNYRSTSYLYNADDVLVERVVNAVETPAGALVQAGRRHELTLDATNWLTSEVDYGPTSASSDDRRVSYQRSPSGWLLERTIAAPSGGGGWASKQSETWERFASGQTKTLTVRDGAGAVLASHLLSYDDASGNYADGQRTADTYLLKGPDPAAPCDTASCTAAYSYDARGRLVQAVDGHGGTIDYTLDPAGNITEETTSQSGQGSVTRTFTYLGEQLQTLAQGGQTERFFYDTEGNLDCVTTSAGSAADCPAPHGGAPAASLLRDYAYDYRNRLAGYRSFAAGVEQDLLELAYDALDRPVEQRERLGPSGAVKQRDLFYEGTGPTLVSEEERTGAGALLAERSYLLDSYASRLGLTRTPAGGSATTYTLAHTPHGSISLLTSETGAVQAAYGYQPYGDPDSALTSGDTATADPLNPYRYTGKRLDPISGSLDMGARRFTPGSARFLQRDQLTAPGAELALTGSLPNSNRYALAAGNPLGYTETDGHWVADVDPEGNTQPLPPPPPPAAPPPAAPPPPTPPSTPDPGGDPNCGIVGGPGQPGCGPSIPAPRTPAPPSPPTGGTRTPAGVPRGPASSAVPKDSGA